MPWVLRGLRNGVVTTSYPKRPDAYEQMFTGSVGVVRDHDEDATDHEGVCPTGAISRSTGRLSVDRGRCILCGECVRAFPSVFRWGSGSQIATMSRPALVVPADLTESEAELGQLRAALARRVKHLRRSVHVRHVDAGSDGSEEWEIQALLNPSYDVHRLGIFITASPRHADILMVTGAGAHGMLAPLARTREGMPNPVVVIAVGTDAISGGIIGSTYATDGGVLGQLPVDVMVPGSPPPPFAILHGILLALGRLPVISSATAAST